MAETTLLELYNKHKKGDWPDKNSVHSYLPVYEELLAPYRHTAKYILEVGLMSGESLRMWSDYFFAGTVYGIDCDIKPINGLADLTGAIAEGMNIVIGDATKPSDIEKFFAGIMFDVVIEDAGHDIEQQIQIYAAMIPYINKGGIYIIEDVQDIDKERWRFELIHGEIIDRRHIKNRYDDVLVIIRF